MSIRNRCDLAAQAASYSLPPMSKRNATSHRLPWKKRKGGVSYGTVDLDSLDEQPSREDVHVWNVTRSETTGRVSATRRNHQHFRIDPLEPSREVQPPTTPTEDIGAPDNPEPSGRPPAKPSAECKNRSTIKENDSVSTMLMS